MSIDCMNRVWKQSQHKGTPLNALLSLADRANEHGICWPGVLDIANRARVEKRSAKRILKHLAASGELYVSDGGGRHRTNLYLVCVGMDDTQILFALTHRQWFHLTVLEAQVALSEIRERQQIFFAANAAEKGDTDDTPLDESDTDADDMSDEKGDIPDTKGDTDDTLYGKGDLHARKGDTSDTKGDLYARKGDTHARKGDTAVSPESSITINQPSINLKEPGALKIFWQTLQTEIAETFDRSVYQMHLHDLVALRFVNGPNPPCLILGTPRKLSLAWLNARYKIPLQTMVQRHAQSQIAIAFELVQRAEPTKEDADA